MATTRRYKGRGPAPSLCVPPVDWPLADRLAWDASFTVGDVFDDGGVAAHWPAKRVRNVAKGWGRFLFFLAERGELDRAGRPADRVNKARLTSYLAELMLKNHGYTIPTRIQELGDALRAIEPDGEWRWTLRAAGRLRACTTAARDKRISIRPIEELISLGFGLMDSAATESTRPKLQRALAYRDGLIVAFLGFHPIRLQNLAALEIGRQITVRGTGFWLQLTAAETKNRRPFNCAVAERLAPRLRRYIDHERRVLVDHDGRASTALWVSLEGGELTEGAIEKRVRKRTAGDGMPISPHLFRSCAATSIAVHAPRQVDIIPGILNHATPRTGEQFYNLAGSIEASRAHAAGLDRLCRELEQQLSAEEISPDRELNGPSKPRHPRR